MMTDFLLTRISRLVDLVHQASGLSRGSGIKTQNDLRVVTYYKPIKTGAASEFCHDVACATFR